MRGIDGRRLHSRIKGPTAIRKSLLATLLRLYRFSQGRATTLSERRWAARWIDLLEAGLLDDDAEQLAPGPDVAINTCTRRQAPVRKSA